MLVNELHQGGIRAILDYDNTVFDNMVLPAGVDQQEVVDHIIFKYGDTPLFCPEPAVMKYYIGNWSQHRLAQWERFKAAIEKQYDPLENYNRDEFVTDELTHGHKIVTNDDLTHGHKVVTNDDLTNGHKIVTNDDLTHGHKVVTNDDLTNGLTVENQISADNASTYQADNKSINSGKDERDIDETHSGKDERDIDETHSGKDERDIDETHSGKDERDFDETHSGKDSRSIHNVTKGNIGVTTSQQMLTQELDIIPRLDLVDFIADDFKDEFCLYVY